MKWRLRNIKNEMEQMNTHARQNNKRKYIENFKFSSMVFAWNRLLLESIARTKMRWKWKWMRAYTLHIHTERPKTKHKFVSKKIGTTFKHLQYYRMFYCCRCSLLIVCASNIRVRVQPTALKYASLCRMWKVNAMNEWQFPWLIQK